MVIEYFTKKIIDSYTDSLDVYNSLSSTEKNYISPRGRYIDSPSLVFRHNEKEGNETIGFVEVYKIPNTYQEYQGSVVLAIKPKYRGSGVFGKLMDICINRMRVKGYHSLIYQVNKNNIASQKAIEKNISCTKHEKNGNIIYKITL